MTRSRPRGYERPALWLQDGPDSGLTSYEQEALWRAAAKGHEANGRMDDRDAALANARLIRRTREARFAGQRRGQR
jgi:hypothetical protein